MHKILFVLIFTALSGGAYSGCTAPEPPHIPDAETTVTAEMVKAQNDVKAFLSEAENFLKCNRNSSKHNKMVDEMKDVGEKFNNVVKAYKARLKNG